LFKLKIPHGFNLLPAEAWKELAQQTPVIGRAFSVNT